MSVLRRMTLVAAFSLLSFVAVALAQQPQPAPVVTRIERFVDHTRVARFRSGSHGPRRLPTYVRYPVDGRALPLIVFAHGFAVTPALYAPLLDAWAHAGYAVAAPVFPVENANAPGGPDENDLANEPQDISFVVTQLLAANADPQSPLYGRIDPAKVAVAGQSDGAETAFATAYQRGYRDSRVRAAVVLSGAELGRARLDLTNSPPLLAVQGTADYTNPPRASRFLFRACRRPKYLLMLVGAGHLPPYTTNAAQLALVERVTIAFLDHYFKNEPLRALLESTAGHSAGGLTADP
jgi:dienelactone hydrolase